MFANEFIVLTLMPTLYEMAQKMTNVFDKCALELILHRSLGPDSSFSQKQVKIVAYSNVYTKHDIRDGIICALMVET
jgi:hypothetical protein